MFTYYNLDNAPEASIPLLTKTKENFGMVPNLMKVFAGAPATLEAYMTSFNIFTSKTSLTPLEQQVVFMTANFENDCHYCVPGHTGMMKVAKMPDDIIEALREGTEIPNAKLQALHDYSKALLDNRGHIGDEALNAFFTAGYNQQQALEVLTGLASKLISNFGNAIAHTKRDPGMKQYDWTHPKNRK